MKLKYKKMILLVSMCTMGIGLVTFSIVGPSVKEVVNATEEQAATLIEEDSTVSIAAAGDESETPSDEAADVIDGEDKGIAGEAFTNRAMVEETDELKKNDNKKINKLIEKYLDAKLSKDITKFEGVVNDTSLVDLSNVERQTNYIEDYHNIDVYTKKGPEEGSFIVYAYHEVKFTSIDTLAPAMNAYYVKADDNGDYYIYLGSVDDDTIAYFDDVNNSEEVMDLIYNVNDKMKKAADSDSALSEFYLKLEETANQVAQNN